MKQKVTPAPDPGISGASSGVLDLHGPTNKSTAIIAYNNEALNKTSQQSIFPTVSTNQFENVHERKQSYRSRLSGQHVSYNWHNLTCEALPQKSMLDIFKSSKSGEASTSKMILKGLSGIVQSGEMWALMGASGAGKTTLLNILNFRTSKTMKLSGKRCLNGAEIGPDVIAAISAFVQQDDLFIPRLTVREHLIFASMVRMPAALSKEERISRVDEVLEELGLWNCRNALIGSPTTFKGISGGERKRLSFATEILTDPKILFCDEPTSGLDSFMAQNVVSMMTKMAEGGKIIICTIHQPSSSVFNMFNHLYLISEGRLAYAGQREGALGFFKLCGYVCPATHNPADFYIRTLAIRPGAADECRTKATAIADAFGEQPEYERFLRKSMITNEKKSQDVAQIELDMRGKNLKYKSSSTTQFRALLWRSFLVMHRDPLLFWVKVAQNISVGTFFAMIYYSSLNYYTFKRAAGVSSLLVVCTLYQLLLSSFSVICTFSLEIPIFLREHWNGMYRCWVYYVAKTCSEIPFVSLFPFLFFPQIWFFGNFEGPFYRLLQHCGALICVSQVGAAIGHALSTWTSSMQAALVAAPVALMPIFLFSGTFVEESAVFGVIKWFKYTSPTFYGSAIIMYTQWLAPTVKIVREGFFDPVFFRNGREVITYYNYDVNNVYDSYIGLGVLFVIWRIFAYIGLWNKVRLG